MNVTLTGMPGAGKSFIGKSLAERLGCSFIEIDKILEEKYNKQLPLILEELGEQPFIQEEAKMLAQTTQAANGLVISPGGSIVYSAEAMQHLKNISDIVYLKVPLEVIEERIGSAPRGIVGLKNRTLANLYRERVPLYEHYAQTIIDANQDTKKVITDITKYLKQPNPHASNSLQI